LVKVVNLYYKRRIKKRRVARLAAVVSLVVLYGTSFTGTIALEPERIKTKHGQVLV
jgi:uncharacterized protein (DUF2141 family)